MFAWFSTFFARISDDGNIARLINLNGEVLYEVQGDELHNAISDGLIKLDNLKTTLLSYMSMKIRAAAELDGHTDVDELLKSIDFRSG